MIETVVTPSSYEVAVAPDGHVVLVAEVAPDHRVMFVIERGTAGQLGKRLGELAGAVVPASDAELAELAKNTWRAGQGPKPRP